MTWPIPVPGAVAERYAAGFETAFALDPNTGLRRPQTVDARDPNTALRAIGVVGEETWTEAYLYQQSLADEMMPDKAQDWLVRHAAEWGVPQLQPLTALGNLIFAGPPNTPLPQGIEVYQGGLRWQTSAAATIGSSGAVSVPSEAEIAGTASNIAGGIVLPLVSPVDGLNPQTATVDTAGFVGGRDLEDVEAWRARILRRIRKRGQAGATADYEGWATDAGALHVSVLPRWVGAGTVGVAALMAGPRVPTSPELLPDYERVLGPDPCVAAVSPTLTERRQSVHLRWTRTGGAARKDYVALAAALGYAITIDEFQPSRVGRFRCGDRLRPQRAQWTWRINLPRTAVVRFRTGRSRTGDRLMSFGIPWLQCQLSQNAPAHTVLIFANTA